jgi:hypothetical protein
MHKSLSDAHPATPKIPWNKGKIIGARPPLQTKHGWSIRNKLLLDGKKRDLAMFNLAIDSKLRGCDVRLHQGRGRCPSWYDSRSSLRPPAQDRTSREVRV